MYCRMGGEVLNLRKTYHIGLEAGFVFSLEQFTPVNVREEVVGLDFRSTVSAQAALWVTVEKARKQILRCTGDDIRAWESKWFLENLAVHLVGVFIVERWQTSQHFVEKHAKRPPVNRLGIAVSKEQLRGKVFGSATECYL